MSEGNEMADKFAKKCTTVFTKDTPVWINYNSKTTRDAVGNFRAETGQDGLKEDWHRQPLSLWVWSAYITEDQFNGRTPLHTINGK